MFLRLRRPGASCAQNLEFVELGFEL
jgi:hypothetical protein